MILIGHFISCIWSISRENITLPSLQKPTFVQLTFAVLFTTFETPTVKKNYRYPAFKRRCFYCISDYRKLYV